MKAVYSFWSRPFRMLGDKMHGAIPNRYSSLAWILSVNLAARHFNEIELYTDQFGLEFLKPLDLPFTKTNVVLDDISPDILAVNCWAFGKIVTYADQSEPFVHIDYDAFLSKPLPEVPDLVVQGPEWGDIYEKWETGIVDMGFNSPYIGMTKNAFNAGVLGGNDISLIRDYANEAIDMVEFVSRNRIKFDSRNYMQRYYFSCFFEQYLIAQFASSRGSDVLYLGDTEERAKEHGYTHLWGGKHNVHIQKQVEEKVKRDFPAAYKNLDKYMKGK